MPAPEHHHDHARLSTSRLEALSDAVFAIAITITVIELKVPLHGDFSSLTELIPFFIAYIISFQSIGTYWMNHHHLLKATDHVSPGIMWANLHLLFWLSLIPFTTIWIGEQHNSAIPTALYAAILFLCAIAYTILQFTVVYHASKREHLLAELSSSNKGLVSLLAYFVAIGAAFINPIISDVLIIIVGIMWLIPDKRIAKFL